MIKRFLLVLLLLSSKFIVKCSELKEAETNEEENLKISGSKRSNEGVSKKMRQKQFEQIVIGSLKRALINLEEKRTVDYSNDPAANFFDKLMKRSIEAKISETGDESLWEMSFIRSLTVDLLNSSSLMREHAILEYFKFVCPFWTHEAFRAAALRQAIKQSIKKLFVDLFEEILKQVDKEKDSSFGTETLLLLKQSAESVTGLNETTIWRVMCTLTVKKFPESVYDSKLRIEEFKGEDFIKNEVFVHLLPILSNLMIETRKDFDEGHDFFELFVLFQLGDLDAELPMGVGGLLLINQMFLRSEINVSAFKQDLNELKLDIVERIFDALFLELEPKVIIKVLFDYSTFSIFEAFLKYSKNLEMTEAFLYEILRYFIGKAIFCYELNFIYAMIAYVNIPRTVWTRLADTFQYQLDKVLAVNQYEALDASLKRYQISLDLKTNEVFEIEFDGEMVDRLAEIKKKPLQLEVARIFLARVCGIPLEMTDFPDIVDENFEWREVVSFINFYVERMAAISGHIFEEGSIIKFKVM